MLIGAGGGFGSDKTSVANKLFKSLDNKGKDAVRYAMLRKSIDTATNTGKPFHPQIFANSMDKLSKRSGVFFTPKDNKMLDGMNKYMAHIQNAGHYAANPPTGNRLLGSAMAGVAYFEPTALISGMTGLIGANQLFRNPKMRQYLTALSTTTPDSLKYKLLVDRINQEALYSISAASAN